MENTIVNEAAHDYGLITTLTEQRKKLCKTPEISLSSKRRQRPIEPQAVNLRISRNRL